VQRRLWLAPLLLLAACDKPLPVGRFASSALKFDPLRFFTGHVRSWGVLENRSGEPTGMVVTDLQRPYRVGWQSHHARCLTFGDGSSETREWHMRRTGPGLDEATATDIIGTEQGALAGRIFHLTWTLAARPGNALANVATDRWMYLNAGGAMTNRTTISKLGVILVSVTERFAPEP